MSRRRCYFLAVLLTLGSSPPLSSLQGQEIKVVLLGTGTPNADPDRSGPGVAVLVGNRAYLVDAGPGVVRRATAAAARHRLVTLEPPGLARVFLTHLHSDHTVGLPDLLLTPWVLEREEPLRVFGPPGTAAMMDHLERAFVLDVRNRLDGAEPANETGYGVRVSEIDSGLVYRDSLVQVRAVRVPHGDWADGMAFAYRFETSDHSVVISGDTGPTEAVARACSGCDILVHEVYSAARLARRTADWQRYHRRAHTSGPELAKLATRAQPGLLILYHQLFWGASVEELLSEVIGGYAGRVVSGRDLDLFPD